MPYSAFHEYGGLYQGMNRSDGESRGKANISIGPDLAFSYERLLVYDTR